MFGELYRYRTMISSLIRRELVGRYKKSVLGFLWSFIDPLLQLLIYTFLFSVILKTNIPSFHICLFVTLVPWLFLSSCMVGGCMAVVSQQDMLKKVYFPREVLPIAFTLAQFVNMVLSFVVVFLMLLFSGYGFNFKALLYLPLVMLIELILALGVTFLCSSITVYLRDMQQILSALAMLLMYASPIIYTIDLIPESIRGIYMWNPITRIVVVYRDVLYYKQIPDGWNLMWAVVESLIVLIIGVVVFRRLSRKFAEEL